MKQIEGFIDRLKAGLHLDKKLIVEKQNRYFLINEALRPLVRKDFFYAGAYLGKVKGKIFFPSFILLAMMAEGKANKTIVDDKAAWLFICGRDIFKRGILNASGSKKKGDYTLIMNQLDECLGFGKTMHNIDEVKNGKRVVVKNISDVGDFLRREKHLKTKSSLNTSWH